ncbi:hypothetical protein F4776DRAFT_598504 [Hypoxylon sp. NC0597]|nr:hypothetical protein F4776DRAFT_598504 [Hypoxylon sp. NC0597]
MFFRFRCGFLISAEVITIGWPLGILISLIINISKIFISFFPSFPYMYFDIRFRLVFDISQFNFLVVILKGFGYGDFFKGFGFEVIGELLPSLNNGLATLIIGHILDIDDLADTLAYRQHIRICLSSNTSLRFA